MTHIPQYQSATNSSQVYTMSEATSWLLRIGGVLTWGLAGLIACVVIGGLGFAFVPVMGSVVALAGTVFLAVTVHYAAKNVRKSRGAAILGYLENAVRLNLPLSLFLRAAARGEGWVMRQRLETLAHGIDSGFSLGMVIRKDVPEISPRTAAAIDAAEQIGQLQPTLSRLVAEDIKQGTPTPPDHVFRIAYPLALCFFMINLLVGVLVFVVPKFKEIFRDFNTRLPPLTEGLISVSTFLADWYIGVVLFVILWLLLIGQVGRTLRFAFTPWWPGLVIRPLVDYVSWHLPLWRRLQRDGALADICQFMADAAKAGVSLPDSLTGATALHMNDGMRNRVMQWRKGIMAGMPTSGAATMARMPNTLVGFLSAGEITGKTKRPEDLAEVLEFLARYYRMRFSRLAALLEAIAEPVMTVSLALLVGTIVLALFLPLAKLIQSVSGTTGGVM